MRIGLVFLLVALFTLPRIGMAQNMPEAGDSIQATAPDSTVRAVLQQADSLETVPITEIEQPATVNSTKAVLLGLIPGGGQIYNKKYWKLPIVYGAFMGCIYAITWNNTNYSDYKTAYFDLNEADPDKPDTWSHSWQDLLPAGANPKEYVTNTNFKESLKRKKDFYRRYRDLSLIITGAVYLLSLVDAYVDAELSGFDISPDLSMRIEPAVMSPGPYNKTAYGLNCVIKF